MKTNRFVTITIVLVLFVSISLWLMHTRHQQPTTSPEFSSAPTPKGAGSVATMRAVESKGREHPTQAGWIPSQAAVPAVPLPMPNNKTAAKSRVLEKEMFFDKRLKREVPVAKGEVLVQFKQKSNGAQISKAIKELGAEVLQEMPQLGTYRLRILEDTSVALFIERQCSNATVKVVEPNFVAKTLAGAQFIPNDPLYPSQWALSKIGAPKAWQATTGGPEVIVAVLDTGVELEHPDLRNKVLRGYDFVNNDPDPSDDNGHGTHVAGIIAAEGNNNVGVIGVAPGCTLLPVKVINGSGEGTYADVINGILFAADHGARVLNFSIGGYAQSQLLDDALEYAHGKGCVLVAAAGNDGSEDSVYPAASPNVLAVAATDQDGQLWPKSNRGSHVALGAPGVGILSAAAGGGYGEATGTSASAAHASGLAALVISHNPNANSAAVERALKLTAAPCDATTAGFSGFGCVNSEAVTAMVVQNLHNLSVVGIRIRPTTFKAGDTVSVGVAVRNNGGSVETNVTVQVSLPEAATPMTVEIPELKPGETRMVSVVWIVTVAGDGRFTVVATIAPRDGESDMRDNVRILRLRPVPGEAGMVTLYENDPPVHSWIAYQAYKLWPGSANTEFAQYVRPSGQTEAEFVNDLFVNEDVPFLWGNSWFGLDWTVFGTSIVEGAYEEDTPFTRSLEHFWDADGQFDSGLPTPCLNDIWQQHSALAHANNLWNTAIRLYPDDRELAYWYLGRVAHLLADMSSPPHVHNDPHAGELPSSVLPCTGGDSTYEEFTAYGKRYQKFDSDDATMPDIGALPLTIPRELGLPSDFDQDLAKLFYNLAQQAQYFDADGPSAAGNSTRGSTAFNLTAQDGTTRRRFGFIIDGGARFVANSSLVELILDGSRRYLVRGSDYWESPWRGRILLSDDVGGQVKSGSASLNVYYTPEGGSHSVVNMLGDLIESGDILDSATEEAQSKLEPLAIGYTAALYKLFWNRTHPHPDVLLQVNSSPASGVNIALAQSDIHGDKDGTTPFERTFHWGDHVQLEAPSTDTAGGEFREWRINGVYCASARSMVLQLSGDTVLTAVYNPVGTVLLVNGSTTPDTVKLNTSRSTQHTIDVLVQNTGANPITVTCTKSREISSWLSLPTSSLTIPGKSAVAYRVSLSVPASADYRQWTGQIMFDSVALPFLVSVGELSQGEDEQFLSASGLIDGEEDPSFYFNTWSGVYDLNDCTQKKWEYNLGLTDSEYDRLRSWTFNVTVRKVDAATSSERLQVKLNDTLVREVYPSSVIKGDELQVKCDLLQAAAPGYNTIQLFPYSFVTCQGKTFWQLTDFRFGWWNSIWFSKAAWGGQRNFNSSEYNTIMAGFDRCELRAHVDSVSRPGQIHLFNNAKKAYSLTIQGSDVGKDVHWHIYRSDFRQDNRLSLRGDSTDQPYVALSNLRFYVKYYSGSPLLTVVKSVSAEQATKGGNVTVTVRARNNGSNIARNVRVTDSALPVGLSLASGSLSADLDWIYPGEEKTNTYVLSADVVGSYTLGSAFVAYEDPSRNRYESTSNPSQLEVRGGTLVVASSVNLSRHPIPYRIDFAATVRSSADQSEVLDAEVTGEIECDDHGTWKPFGTVLLGYSPQAGAYVGSKEVVTNGISLRARVLASRPYYDAGASAYTNVFVPAPPSITRQPQDVATNQGAIVTFNVTATGTEPLSYQWYGPTGVVTNGARFSGANSATLVIASVQANDSGNYIVLVTNTEGSAVSAPAVLVVSPAPVAPSIVVPPSNITVTQGQTATFSVVATGTSPLSYLWRKGSTPLTDGGRMSGATSPSLTITDVQYSDGGGYSVVVSNSVGAVTSSPPAELTVLCTYTIAPSSAAYDWPGGSGTVTVTAGNGCPWTASNGVTWVTITAGSSGAGTGTVTYVVEPNYTTNARQADLAIAGHRFTVTQAAYPEDRPTVAVVEAPSINSFKTLTYRQTGLIEAVVQVTNPGGSAQPALVLWVRDLPATVKVYNATGSSNGVPYLKHNFPLAPGASVDLHIEYLVADRRTVPNPTLVAEWAAADPPFNPQGTPAPVDRALRWTNGYFLVDYSTVSNAIYYVQYSADLTNWRTALPGRVGTGSRMQWLDNGPPKTESPPGDATNRFYRVIRVP